MAIITLVGEKLARPGVEFIFYGPAEPCRTCKLAGVCVGNLEQGRRYKILRVRSMPSHSCPLHEGKVRVVEVVEPSIEVAIEPRLAVAGSVIRLRFENCNDPEKAELFRPEGLFEGDHVKIIEVTGEVECDGKTYKVVKVMRKKD
ncbi:hypothetical protein CL1_1644 [Thermococcus cleftensis]|uniref:UPF0179 protein CL1_1644 n=1 Tax=Thermococcus cleftensis (strain DSM 27260 / KACC 17922 / CL1) TaxID=163003 RepID=I3ZVV7_THECF|nr:MULTISPECIES: UPF0179 family protein [Thermococcus]AFL95841.1 hypothetical protein CL1_1644 [Thermococcus cleftensis]NJE02653.1 UPF0179 family protein [Thermococcus sp. MV11]